MGFQRCHVGGRCIDTMRVWLLLVSVSAKCGDELEPLKLDPVDTLAGQVKGVYVSVEGGSFTAGRHQTGRGERGRRS